MAAVGDESMSFKNGLGVLLLAITAAACGGSKETQGEQSSLAENGGAPSAVAVTRVDEARLVAADDEPSNWLSHGRTYDEQRFSPLDQINRDNVGELGLAWYFDVPTRRGMEATPIVIDGRMYVTGSWSIVYALNAATGEELWRYDPKVPRPSDVLGFEIGEWHQRPVVGLGNEVDG